MIEKTATFQRLVASLAKADDLREYGRIYRELLSFRELKIMARRVKPNLPL